MRVLLNSAPALRSRPPLLKVDEFGDPIQITVGGIVVAPKASDFPLTLEGPESSMKATITPFADVGSVLYAPLADSDFIAAFFLGVALLLGPDFLLAPAGLVGNRGIRPGYALERIVGGLIDADSQWLRDRREGLQSDAPLAVRLPILVLGVLGGLVLNRLLLVALEDQTFVTSLGITSCIGGALLEVIREPLPTRAERDLDATLTDEFLLFSNSRLTTGGRCHETDIITAFRKFYPRYRYREMGRTSDGVDLADERIVSCIRRWNTSMGRPAERQSSGWWKGISVVPRDTA